MSASHVAAPRGDQDQFELDPTEHMLLWSFRAMAIGRGDCPMLRAVFGQACGPLADQALTALFVLVKQLGWRGQRRLRLHTPGCASITGDEMLVLAAFSAAQAQDEGRLTMWLGRLMDAAPEPPLEASVRMVADLLARNGRHLPSRDPDAAGVGAQVLAFPAASGAVH